MLFTIELLYIKLLFPLIEKISLYFKLFGYNNTLTFISSPMHASIPKSTFLSIWNMNLLFFSYNKIFSFYLLLTNQKLCLFI